MNPLRFVPGSRFSSQTTWKRVEDVCFGTQQMGSPKNKLPAALASGTLPLTHHVLWVLDHVREVSSFLGFMRERLQKGDAEFFSQGIMPGTAREEPPEQSPSRSLLGSEAPSRVLTPGWLASAFRTIVGLRRRRAGPGRGTPGHCLKLELAKQSTPSPRRHTGCPRNSAFA